MSRREGAGDSRGGTRERMAPLAAVGFRVAGLLGWAVVGWAVVGWAVG